MRCTRLQSLEWRPSELIEGLGDPDRSDIVGHEILQQEELHVTLKVLEELEEGLVPRKHVAKWAPAATVVPSYALHCEVEPISDTIRATTRLVDRPLPIDPVAGKYHHPANRVPDGVERIQSGLRNHFPDLRRPFERRDHRVAG